MIPIKNVFYMLAYAFRALDRKAYSPLKSEDFANAEDLLAAILILGVEEQFKRGVSRAYIEEESPLTPSRGASGSRNPSGRAGEMRVSSARGMNSRSTPI